MSVTIYDICVFSSCLYRVEPELSNPVGGVRTRKYEYLASLHPVKGDSDQISPHPWPWLLFFSLFVIMG